MLPLLIAAGLVTKAGTITAAGALVGVATVAVVAPPVVKVAVAVARPIVNVAVDVVTAPVKVAVLAAELAAETIVEVATKTHGTQRETNKEWGQSKSKSSTRKSSESRIDPESSSYDNNDYNNEGNADDDDQGEDEDADSNEESDDASDSESDEEEQRRKKKKRSLRIRSIHRHIVARFMRWLRYGGVLQHASDGTQIPINDIVRRGASQYQDRNSGRGRNVHAAHVVRDGEINPVIQRHYPRLYRKLRNFLGHTQNVPIDANHWQGLGGVMDLFQQNYMEMLLEINFNGAFTRDVERRLINLRDAYINVLRTRMRGRISDTEKEEIKMAIKILSSMDAKTLFESGKKGYDGGIMKHYR